MLLENKNVVLRTIDPNFSIEHAFFISFVGAANNERLLTNALETLPSNADPMSTETSLRKLEKINNSKLHSFANAATQSVLQEETSFVKLIDQNKTCKFGNMKKTSILYLPDGYNLTFLFPHRSWAKFPPKNAYMW